MAQAVVDGRGMSSVATEKDHQMFIYDRLNTPPDTPTIIEAGKKQDEKKQMEKILSDASRSIGKNLVTKIQGLDVVLREDAGMKVNKKSQDRVCFCLYVSRHCCVSKNPVLWTWQSGLSTRFRPNKYEFFFFYPTDPENNE